MKKLFTMIILVFSVFFMASHISIFTASASAESVVDVFMNNYSTWKNLAFSPMSGNGVTFLDIDFDGELELVVGSCSGSGLFTNLEFYKIIDGNVVQLNSTADDFPDVAGNDAMDLYRNADGKMEYYGSDALRGGWAYSESIFSSFAYHSGENAVVRTNYYSSILELDTNSNETYSWHDYLRDVDITEEEYHQLKSTTEANLTNLNLTYKFVDIQKLSDSEIKTALIDSYKAFSYTGFTPAEQEDEPEDKPEDEQKEEENYPLSEEDLKAKVKELGTVTVWQYADFDGNGKKEAFAVLTEETSEDIFDIKEIYFINADGETNLMPEGSPQYLSYYPDSGKYVEYQGKGFFTVDMGNFGSGYITLLYSVKNNEPYELNVSRKLQGFLKDETTGKFYTIQDDLIPGGGHDFQRYELTYNKKTQEFSIGDKLEVPETTKTTKATTKTTKTTTKTTTTTTKTTKKTTPKATTTTTKTTKTTTAVTKTTSTIIKTETETATATSTTTTTTKPTATTSEKTTTRKKENTSSRKSSRRRSRSSSLIFPGTGEDVLVILFVTAFTLGIMEFFRRF